MAYNLTTIRVDHHRQRFLQRGCVSARCLNKYTPTQIQRCVSLTHLRAHAAASGQPSGSFVAAVCSVCVAVRWRSFRRTTATGPIITTRYTREQEATSVPRPRLTTSCSTVSTISLEHAFLSRPRYRRPWNTSGEVTHFSSSSLFEVIPPDFDTLGSHGILSYREILNFRSRTRGSACTRGCSLGRRVDGDRAVWRRGSRAPCTLNIVLSLSRSLFPPFSGRVAAAAAAAPPHSSRSTPGDEQLGVLPKVFVIHHRRVRGVFFVSS